MAEGPTEVSSALGMRAMVWMLRLGPTEDILMAESFGSWDASIDEIDAGHLRSNHPCMAQPC